MTPIQRTRRIILSARKRSVVPTRPSFLSGAARLVDLGGVFNRFALLVTPAQSESQAMARDWAHVGTDLTRAIEQTRKKL